MNSPSKKTSFFLLALSTLIPLVVGLTFPIITDEAYYLDWATRSGWPRLGFFDHPPMVSWLAGASNMYHHIVSARIVVWVLHLMSMFYVWKTAKLIIPNHALTATLLVASTLGAIANGFLVTPDAGIMAMWIIAVHESILAIRGHRGRWLTAGLATGLGLWSKYTMVLIGPVFLWGLLRQGRRQLFTIWPYAGGIVCALVIAPHIWWQSQNDWITFRFQFGHGFSIQQSIASISSLPVATDPSKDDHASRKLQKELFDAMSSVSGFDEVFVSTKPDKSKLEKAIQYTGDFLGGVAGLWGIYSIALLGWLFIKRRALDKSSINVEGTSIIEAAAFFPLLFFGILSPVSKIEANWPAMHMAPLAIWISARVFVSTSMSIIALTSHAAAVLILGLMIHQPQLFPMARNNRILLESKGFQALGNWVAQTFPGQAIAVDSYQLKSAVRYQVPGAMVAQWPGITRGSEYTRNDPDDVVVEQSLMSQENVTIISLKPYPKVIKGFEAITFSGMRVCPDGSSGIFNISNLQLPCEKGLREWWITTYKNQNPR